jgi:hypothetical protein
MKWLVLVLVIGLIGWQVFRGATLNKIGFAGAEISLSSAPPKMCMNKEPGFDRVGSDYNGGAQMVSLESCEHSCLVDEKCQAYSFNKNSSQCWMKSAPGLRKPDANYMTAVKARC